MKKSKVEEVKERFKYAKVIKFGDRISTINIKNNGIYESETIPGMVCEGISGIVLYKPKVGFSEILEYKALTIEEVKEYFKNAKKVQWPGTSIETIDVENNEVRLFEDGNIAVKLGAGRPFLNIWTPELGFALIVEEKHPFLRNSEVIDFDLPRRKHYKAGGDKEKEPVYDKDGYLVDFHKAEEAWRDIDFSLEGLSNPKSCIGDKFLNSFDAVVDKTLKTIRELLVTKGKEYRRNNNPFHNFDTGAALTGKLREEVLQGFLLKHLISAGDIRNDLKEGKLPSREKVEEKYNDILVYFLIEKASIIDRIDRHDVGDTSKDILKSDEAQRILKHYGKMLADVKDCVKRESLMIECNLKLNELL